MSKASEGSSAMGATGERSPVAPRQQPKGRWKRTGATHGRGCHWTRTRCRDAAARVSERGHTGLEGQNSPGWQRGGKDFC